MSRGLQTLRGAYEYGARLEMRPHRAINFARVRGWHHAQHNFSAAQHFGKCSSDVDSGRELKSREIDFVVALRTQQINDVRTVRPNCQSMRAERTSERDGQCRAPTTATNNRNFLQDSLRPISMRGSVPAMRRSMFFRCLKIIKTDARSVPAVTAVGGACPGA